ncbi:hypothetical protein ACM39_17170 [Chryseobacterium sp. FH2]|nr:hypothetical protein ACM39_17170 [Chryseobacterium sp. FH2]
MKRIIQFFRKKKKETLATNFKKPELPPFFTERKIEKIYPIDFPGDKFGRFSNFFDFNSSYNFILFLDLTSNSDYQIYLKENFPKLQNQFSEKDRNFIQIPDYTENTELIDYKYFFPNSSTEFNNFNNISKEMYSNIDSSILQFLGYKGNIKTGFLSVYERNIVFVEKLEDETISDYVEKYILNLRTKNSEQKHTIFYSLDKENDSKRFEPSIEIDIDTEKIVEEIHLRVQKLVETGHFFLIAPLMEKLIKQPFFSNTTLSPIKITSDYQILLPDYDLEIKMNHLTKAIYFLFLHENRPIDLKQLSLYKDKLFTFYKYISYKNSLDEMEQSIDALLEPESNLIYMHLSRIKSAFIKKMDYNFAKNYYIVGSKGRPKYISLNKDLIIWEK